MPVDREGLLSSPAGRRDVVSTSIGLTPANTLPFSLVDRHHTDFLQGLRLADKLRTEEQEHQALVQFAGRDDAAFDIDLIRTLFAEALSPNHGSLRLLSGLHAQTVTLMAMTDIGDTVAVLSEEGGCHYSARAIMERLGANAVDLPVDRSGFCMDCARSSRRRRSRYSATENASCSARLLKDSRTPRSCPKRSPASRPSELTSELSCARSVSVIAC